LHTYSRPAASADDWDDLPPSVVVRREGTVSLPIIYPRRPHRSPGCLRADPPVMGRHHPARAAPRRVLRTR